MPTSLARHARTIGALLLTVAYSTDVVWADEIDQCMTNLQAAYESPQQFTQEGEITCPAGDVVGFPPRIRRNDRSGAVTYMAPPGTIIQNRSIDAISVDNISQNNGRYGQPSISADNRTVTVPISCDGKGPGEGRAWQNIRIRGVIIRQPAAENIKSWAIQCVRCVAEKNCPAP
ncbi:hypothetical protein [Bradyrhizobium canariense]|uniref:hypothetical protein n=1 Tax=Bradyrhizobium TaxID=374 RepID=UPI0011778F39|nr:hypothetical protein [Bradyrhizobium canariense]